MKVGGSIKNEDVIYSIKFHCSKSDFLKTAGKLIDKIIKECESPSDEHGKLFAKKIERTRILIVGTVNGIDENLILFVKEPLN